MGRRNHGFGKGNGRVDPVTVQADVEIAAIDAVDPEPIDKFVGGFFAQGLQHAPPGGDLLAGTMIEAAAHGFDTGTGLAVQGLGLGIQQRRQRPD